MSRPDLHLGNVLLRHPESLNNLSPTEFYNLYGEPEAKPVVRLDDQRLSEGVPSYGIMPVFLGQESEQVSLSEAKILLTDFGELFLLSESPQYHCNTPDLLVPPEVYLFPVQPISFPADIWVLACTIWSILGSRPLFEGENAYSEWMIKEQVDVLGKLPDNWWHQWDARKQWFNEDGSRNSSGISRGWEERFEYSVQEPRRNYGLEGIGREESRCLFSMLSSILAFRSDEGITTEEIIRCEWIVKWALLQLEKIIER